MNTQPGSSPQYGEVAEALSRLGQAGSVAEAHGALSGMLCAGGSRQGKAWLNDILAGSDDGAARDVLEALSADTITQLKEPGFVFQPLLPDDETELGLRVQALGEWAQAYLYGLGAGGFARDNLSVDVAEALKDLEEISKVEFEADHADEADEFAYAEVLEHVRMIAMFMKDSVGALRDDEGLH